MSPLLEPEIDQLSAVFGDRLTAKMLAQAPGGWRTLSRHELREMNLVAPVIEAVLAMQQLVQRSYPPLPLEPLVTPQRVVATYDARLGDLPYEVLIAIGLDSRHRLRGEVELARGGAHAAALTPSDVLRPLVRLGAACYVLVHNHPSGDPTPSEADITMTEALAAASEIVGIPLVDHLVIGGRSQNYASFFDLGLLPHSSRQPTANDASS